MKRAFSRCLVTSRDVRYLLSADGNAMEAACPLAIELPWRAR